METSAFTCVLGRIEPTEEYQAIGCFWQIKSLGMQTWKPQVLLQMVLSALLHRKVIAYILCDTQDGYNDKTELMMLRSEWL